MKLIGLMAIRNEEWVLGWSARVALKYCDGVVFFDHASTDRTVNIIEKLDQEYGRERIIYTFENDPTWHEMDYRQRMLELGRKHGGTHWALIDADEVITANLVDMVRPWTYSLQAGQAMELPMITPTPDFIGYRADNTVWSNARISFLVADAPHLSWKAQEDGYTHHARLPRGIAPLIQWPIADKRDGGIMHLQWLNYARLEAKHVFYRMMETIRWPGRMSTQELNEKYDNALAPWTQFHMMPNHFLQGYSRLMEDHLHTHAHIWYQDEIERMLKEHGREAFKGLDLKGY